MEQLRVEQHLDMIGTGVVIQRVADPKHPIIGIIHGIDSKEGFLVRGVLAMEATEYVIPVERVSGLLKNGWVDNNRGSLRYALRPLTKEAEENLFGISRNLRDASGLH